MGTLWLRLSGGESYKTSIYPYNKTRTVSVDAELLFLSGSELLQYPVIHHIIKMGLKPRWITYGFCRC